MSIYLIAYKSIIYFEIIAKKMHTKCKKNEYKMRIYKCAYFTHMLDYTHIYISHLKLNMLIYVNQRKIIYLKTLLFLFLFFFSFYNLN